VPVDSFKYLPRVLAAYYRMTDQRPELPIPWTPLAHPLTECVFGLVTSGGLYHLGVEPSPLIKETTPRFIEIMRQRRRGARG